MQGLKQEPPAFQGLQPERPLFHSSEGHTGALEVLLESDQAKQGHNAAASIDTVVVALLQGHKPAFAAAAAVALLVLLLLLLLVVFLLLPNQLLLLFAWGASKPCNLTIHSCSILLLPLCNRFQWRR